MSIHAAAGRKYRKLKATARFRSLIGKGNCVVIARRLLAMSLLTVVYNTNVRTVNIVLSVYVVRNGRS